MHALRGIYIYDVREYKLGDRIVVVKVADSLLSIRQQTMVNALLLAA